VRALRKHLLSPPLVQDSQQMPLEMSAMEMEMQSKKTANSPPSDGAPGEQHLANMSVRDLGVEIPHPAELDGGDLQRMVPSVPGGWACGAKDGKGGHRRKPDSRHPHFIPTAVMTRVPCKSSAAVAESCSEFDREIRAVSRGRPRTS